MLRRYFISNSLDDLEVLEEQLEAAGVSTPQIHVLSLNDTDVEHLVWLRSRIGDNFLDGVVITTGPYAYRRQDGIAIVPLALLGP